MPQFAKVLSRDVGAFSNQAGARRSARPGVRLAQTGSGTSSLCEMKPDPIARADASPTRPYPGNGMGSGTCDRCQRLAVGGWDVTNWRLRSRVGRR
jgi:hypothetical protein